ncbi:Mce family protein [Gordonia effusa NBRC 100432]|uniref:Mce family protein n=1 Tax=Gordonia effusa NBRC 100432 TaxID=1077974 RepID=H0R168_9ACTN|nr:MCE family protein [Gordonia effusa]GAB18819.1 Mce family protein [Gordonia effusa NBRC 100432]
MSAERAKIRKAGIGFAIFAVVALLLTYTIWSTLERSVSGSTRSFSTLFHDASGLAVGDDVRMAGVRVGRVDEITLEDGKALVSFEVRDDQPVYTSTAAAIRYQNLIGQRYVALSLAPGQPSNPLSAGSRLQQPSEDSFDVTKLLAGFQPVFDTLEPEQINALSEGLIQAFQGNSVSLTYSVTQVGKLANDMANRDVVLGAIIDNLSAVMRDLATQGNQIGTLVTSTSTIIESLNTNSAAFGKSVSQIGQTAAGFADVLGSSRTSLRNIGGDARKATATLISSGAKLDNTARVLPQFLGHFPFVLGQGTYLSIYVCDLDISIGNVLLPPGLFNKIGGTSHSVVCR